jgi:adhesin/invasin
MPPAQTLHTSSSSRSIAYLISIQVNTPAGGTWLKTSAAQGQTPDTVDVSVIPSGLAEGIYDGSILFTPTEPGLAPVTVPVTLVVGCVRGGCPAPPPLNSPVILGLVNGASFQNRGAPGAAMTIFGRNLSTTTTQALTYPLPTTLGSTTVTVNGVLAPLYYVSPGQINFQLPSGTTAGTPNVVVTAGSQQGSSAGQPTVITSVAPGLFMDGFRAAALNPDLTVHTAATPQPAGAILAFFITAQGAVSPGVADGTAAPATPLSLVQGVSGAAIGGRAAEVIFAGLAPGYAGLAQINVRIPEGLGPGDHPAFITIDGQPSNAGLVTVR